MNEDAKCHENFARHLSQTHNNKKPPFGDVSFTSTGARIFWVTLVNVRFPIGKVTLLGPSGKYATWPLHQ